MVVLAFKDLITNPLRSLADILMFPLMVSLAQPIFLKWALIWLKSMCSPSKYGTVGTRLSLSFLNLPFLICTSLKLKLHEGPDCAVVESGEAFTSESGRLPV